MTPGAIGSNPRVAKEADSLHASGHKVHVCSTRTLDAVDQLDDGIIDRAGWTITRLDLRSTRARLKPRLITLAVRQIWKLKHWPALSPLAHSPYGFSLQNFVSRYPADLYLAHYPAALAVAAQAAQKHGGLYAYDAEDFHLGDWPDGPAYDTERQLVRDIESRFLPGCAYVTAASPLIADALVEAYGIESPQVVLNTFPLSQAPVAPTPRGNVLPRPSLYWFSQTIGPGRGIECAVRAIGLSAHRPHLYLRGTSSEEFVAQIERLALAVGAQSRIHFLPPAAPEQMETLASNYDLGLASEVPVSRNRKLCLTNKLFSYILAGLPPLMSTTPAQQRFASEAGLSDLLYPIDNAPALAALIDRMFDDPAQLAALRERIWRLGQEQYNWERECAFVLSAVETL